MERARINQLTLRKRNRFESPSSLPGEKPLRCLRTFLSARTLTLIAVAASGFSFGAAQTAVKAPPKARQARRDFFPAYFGENFDYSKFMRFDAENPPVTGIYQSNGFLALVENGFGEQKVMIPVSGEDAPDVRSDALGTLALDAPVLVDGSGRTFDLAASPAVRRVSYFADRTEYRAAFEGGPTVQYTVYPIHGKFAAAFRIRLEKAHGSVRVSLHITPLAFTRQPGSSARRASFGSSHWPYRLLLASVPNAGPESAAVSGADANTLTWRLDGGQTASIVLASGEDDSSAAATLNHVTASPDLLARATRAAWNRYLSSAPLVAPAQPLKFKIATTGEDQTITPEDLVRSELWQWRGVLTNTVQSRYLPATPLVLADWQSFMGMWSNDGIAEALALASTDRKDLTRAAILNWFHYAVNDLSDGYACWTLFPSGRTTRQGEGPERDSEAVPLQAALVGQYIRLTGDVSILDEKPGGHAGDRTLWQDLIDYQRNLMKVRDINHDGLIDWTHMWETGWDDKESPFVDSKPNTSNTASALPCGFPFCKRYGAPTSAVNEQVFNLWSLQEMAWLARLRGEDSSEWQREFQSVRNTVRAKLWDEGTQRYWDLDVEGQKLWTRGENLDAYYLLFYESDPLRIAAMMKRLDSPSKFNGALLPTLAFDTPQWGGYWRGPSWPREYSHFALGLSRSNQDQEAFLWLARGIVTNLGPVLPENIDPVSYPHEHKISGVRAMGYDALDSAVLPDVAGLRVWGGEDLTVKAAPELGKLYVRGAKWMGRSYDAIFTPHQPTRIWRNGHELPSLSSQTVWRAIRGNDAISFQPVAESPSARQLAQ